MQQAIPDLQSRDAPNDVLEYYRQYRNEELIKYAPYRPGLTVLDCQCGKGVALKQLRGRTGATWGIDLSREDLTFTPLPRLVSVASTEYLPFADGVFDVVICQREVPWMVPENPLPEQPSAGFPDQIQQGARRNPTGGVTSAPSSRPASVLRELARVLCPKGRLVFLASRSRWPGADYTDARDTFHSAGLAITQQEPFDYLAYPAAALGGKVPMLARSYIGTALIQMMFAIDRILASMPGFHVPSWHLIVVAEKTE